MTVAEVRVLEREEPPFYTPSSLRRRLSISERHMRNLLRSGEIPSYKIGNCVRIDPEDVDSYLARRRTDRRAA